MNSIKPYVSLMRLDKPVGIFLLLWPTLWALWLASHGRPNVAVLAIFVIGVILMRSAGCVINDIADRHVDGYVERTRYRPLVTGQIKVKQAWALFFALIVCAFFLVLMLNFLTIKLAIVGAIATVAYPFLKRFTHLPQVGLGVAFAWGVPMAFAALNDKVPFGAWLLFFAVMLWIIAYDTLYAMVDREDDLKIGIKSTAILCGSADRLIIGLLQVNFLLVLVLIGFLFHLHLFYYLCLTIAVGLFCYQQYLIKDRVSSYCFQAFINNHVVGLVIFIGIVLGFI